MSAGSDSVLESGDVRVDTFVTGSWRENCYVVTERSSGDSAVIDPGDDAERIIAHVADSHLNVRFILCSHAHYDHVGAVVALCDHTDLPCHVHQEDTRLLKRAPLYAMSFEKRSIEVPKSVQAFENGDAFELGALSFRVFSSPGHTPGSVCFRYGDLLFAGDTILREKRGRTDLPGGDAAALEKSIDALLSAFEEDLVVLPGHGRPWSLDEARSWWAREKTQETP